MNDTTTTTATGRAPRRRGQVPRRRRARPLPAAVRSQPRDRARAGQPRVERRRQGYIDFHLSSVRRCSATRIRRSWRRSPRSSARGPPSTSSPRPKSRSRSGWSRRSRAGRKWCTTPARAPRRRSTACASRARSPGGTRCSSSRARGTHARLQPVGHRADLAVGLPARQARFGRNPGAGRRDGPRHPVQRRRARGRDDRAQRRRSRRGDRRAAAARAPAGAGFPAGAARGDGEARHRAGVRRDRDRVPDRVGAGRSATASCPTSRATARR